MKFVTEVEDKSYSIMKDFFGADMKPTIIIDAGHGGWDNGASYNGRLEKNDNLNLALLVGNKLEQEGYPVFFTRTNDIYQSPVMKAQLGNTSEGDYFVSFHRNAAATPNLYSGAQVLVYNKDGKSYTLAEDILKNITAMGFEDLGVEERPDLAALRRTRMPAVLIETGFVDSDKDNALFDSDINALADAIVKGIMEGTAEVNVPIEVYRVQVGLYRRFENAAYALQNLRRAGYDGFVDKRGNYYVVVTNDVATVDEARQLEQRLQKDGFDTLIVSHMVNAQ